MNNRITKTIEKYNMIANRDRVLVACSGGADSMLLLQYFLDIKDKYNLNVSVAHIEHGIRGQESVSDSEFVRAFCEDNNVPFHILQIDAVKESEKLGLGVEEYSRQRRYAFFDSIACDKIATAHNLSDNVETLLFRLCRGTGIKGACAIPPVRGKIIRPLIEISSDDVRAYCDSHKIAYRIDSTNASNDYTRNYIRNIVIPDLMNINSDFETAVSNFISDINQDTDFIYSYANDVYDKVLVDNKLDISLLKKYDMSIIKRVIIKYFNSYDIKLDRLHLNSVLTLLNHNGRIQICGVYYAVSDNGYIRFADFSQKEKKFAFVSKILKISELDKKSVDFYCDYDKIIGKINIRQRQAGDKIRPANRNCIKSLKKLFNELKIPQETRDNIPIVADDKGVIGIVGYCVDERVKIDVNTKKILSLRLPSEDC